MVICLCKGVTDSKIRWLVQNGTTSAREVMRTSQAGSDCGSCVCQVRELVERTRAEACSETTCCHGQHDKASNE